MRILVFGFCLSAGIVNAQCHVPDTWDGPRQGERIREGWRSGELTREEMIGLHQQRKHIQHQKRWMLRDGRLGPAERRKLERMHHRLDREIWRQKHDGDTRYHGY